MSVSWLPKKSVVVPVDFSDESLAAVDTALQMVQSSADLHVIHVLPKLSAAEPGVVWETISDESRQEHAEHSLRERLSGPAYEGMHLKATVGDPGHEIADFAREVQAELIVMPSHGRTGVKRLLMGSVAERVVRLAHVPVLILRKG